MADLAGMAQSLVLDMTRAGKMVATAESCTGGLIAATITEIPGSSAVLDRGFVTYSNEAKEEMIGVSVATLQAHGAVSRETAVEMAEGALARSKSDYAVSVTGIAGPDGGTVEKPVGLVHMALARRNGATEHTELRFDDLGRAYIREATVKKALEALIKAL
ncbi:CinA family protein [Nitratireductor sp. XY-223]|uniref:CinA family protein n=1 Tax=Nitratireductor sp. XY-223 TaxID=2561926 RepID=UPI0010A9DEB4|nr:CinA family protein [Nitratireductor sp. XY-223]